MNRARRWAGLWCAALLAIMGTGGFVPVAAATSHGGYRIFAVDAVTGHLAQVPFCRDCGGFGSATEVDSQDWRVYSQVFAVNDGPAAILYAVTMSGELWWWRQERVGAGLGAPVRIGHSIDWFKPVVFASVPGYLQVGEFGAALRTYRHEGWASGGASVFEEPALFLSFNGPVITGLSGRGFAVGAWNGTSYRVWRNLGPAGGEPDDLWWPSGRLPAQVSGVVNDGDALFGVDSNGGIVLMRQREDPICLLYNMGPWVEGASVAGSYARVVVPVRDGQAGPPAVALPPPMSVRGFTICGHGGTWAPWEWQRTQPTQPETQ